MSFIYLKGTSDTLSPTSKESSMRISGYVAAVALVFAVTAPESFAQTVSTPTMPADYNFIFQPAYGGWGEVMAGQLAPQRSTNPAVLQAASTVVANRTQANQELGLSPWRAG